MLRILLPLLLMLLSSMPAWAEDSSQLCISAARQAAADAGVPESVLLAVALTETGRVTAGGSLRPWPWALNRGGESHWFDTRADALSDLQAALDAGATNIDIGCFQLNWRWHGAGFSSLGAMMDPVTNAAYAARLLARHYRESGDWRRAAGAYHSATPTYADRYLARFDPIHEALAAGTPSALPEEAAERQNGFPLLQGGEGRTAGSLVPLAGVARPLFGRS